MPELVCLDCGLPFLGKKGKKYCTLKCQRNSPIWKQNIGKGNKGKLLGRESFKKKMSEVTKGPNNPRWIPDRSKLKIRRAGVEKFLLEKWRKEVFERDDYTCQICGAKGVRLNADHIKPVRLFPELAIDLSNGRTLCVPCHRNTDTYSGKVLKLTRNDF